ncbi:MAG: hypothetical protein WAZ77_14160 [Candidatus Nitrosopolaris sp.]
MLIFFSQFRKVLISFLLDPNDMILQQQEKTMKSMCRLVYGILLERTLFLIFNCFETSHHHDHIVQFIFGLVEYLNMRYGFEEIINSTVALAVTLSVAILHM